MKQRKSNFDNLHSLSLEYLFIAKSLLQQHLPEHVRALVDFASLVRMDRAKTNPKLQKRHKDMTYQA